MEGQPLHLRQAAALVRAGERTFAELAAAAERDPESLDWLAIDALPNPQRRVLAMLALAGGALLPPDLLSAMASVADIREAISDLHARGLAGREEDRFGLPTVQGRRLPPAAAHLRRRRLGRPRADPLAHQPGPRRQCLSIGR